MNVSIVKKPAVYNIFVTVAALLYLISGVTLIPIVCIFGAILHDAWEIATESPTKIDPN